MIPAGLDTPRVKGGGGGGCRAYEAVELAVLVAESRRLVKSGAEGKVPIGSLPRI